MKTELNASEIATLKVLREDLNQRATRSQVAGKKSMVESPYVNDNVLERERQLAVVDKILNQVK